MKIIRRREHHEETYYLLHFTYKDMPTAGFAFDCDEKGNIDTSLMKEGNLESYQKCLTGKVRVQWDGKVEEKELNPPFVDECVRSWTDPTIGKCDCGEEVPLDRFTNTCHRCERDYNSAGQELAPRCQWGEETFETASDILAIDGMSTDRLLED